MTIPVGTPINVRPRRHQQHALAAIAASPSSNPSRAQPIVRTMPQQSQAPSGQSRAVQRATQQLVHLVPPNFQPYLPTVISAAKQYGIPPSVLLAQIDQESDFGRSPGTFSGSSAGAQGVSQFIPGTAAAYGVDVRNNPKAIRSQIVGQAKYMSDLVKQTGSLPAALTQYSGGYAASDYAQPILTAAKNYSAADKLVGSKLPRPYVRPIAQPVSQWGRIDQGVDFAAPPGTPIQAIGRAKYLGQGEAWGPEAGGGGSGYGVLYKLLHGPHKGEKVYTYEGIAPAGPSLSPGETIRRGQTIAQTTPGSIETGFATRSGAPTGSTGVTGKPLPASHYTSQGRAFYNFLKSIPSGGFGGLGTASLSGPAAAVAASTGVSPQAAQTAVQSARQQRQQQGTPPLVQLQAPNAAGPPMPEALAGLFGGQLPVPAGGSSGRTPSTTELATLLAQLAQRQTTPLSSLRRRRAPYGR